MDGMAPMIKFASYISMVGMVFSNDITVIQFSDTVQGKSVTQVYVCTLENK